MTTMSRHCFQQAVLEKLDGLGTQLEDLTRWMRVLNRKEKQIMSIEQDILDAVAAQTTEIQSDKALLQQLLALATPQNLPKLQQALQGLLSNTQSLAEARVANTPAEGGGDGGGTPTDQPA